MNDLRRAGLAIGAAAAVVLPGAAHADEASGSEASQVEGTQAEASRTGGTQTADETGLSPASPLDLVLSTPGDVVGALADGSPI